MESGELNTPRRSAKQRLVFDRRYGWVFDEWKDPSEEALAGGRGMFCVVPLAKSCFETVSQSINLVANSTIKILERPEILSPQVLQTNINDQLQKVVSSTKKSGLDMLLFKRSSTCESTSESHTIESCQTLSPTH